MPAQDLQQAHDEALAAKRTPEQRASDGEFESLRR